MPGKIATSSGLCKPEIDTGETPRLSNSGRRMLGAVVGLEGMGDPSAGRDDPRQLNGYPPSLPALGRDRQRELGQ